LKILLFLSIIFSGNSYATVGSIYTKEKLYTGWFNSLGGLDNIINKYALLTIDKYGGISIIDHFNVFADYVGKHWVTIDEVYRAKDWKDNVQIYATFHHINKLDGKEYTEQGNGSFSFPPNGTIQILQGAAPGVNIIDHYAEAHPHHQDHNNDPCLKKE